MNKCRNCGLNRADLTNRAFSGCEIAKEQARVSLDLAVYAESIGATSTASQLRAAAMHFSKADIYYRTIIKQGYLAKRRRRGK